MSVNAQLAGRLLRPPSTLSVSSGSFARGAPIPAHFAGRTGRSPQLAWSHVPSETREVAVLCEDPDAPLTQPFVHWVVYGIPPEVTELDEGLPPSGAPLSSGVTQGLNSYGSAGWDGPEPPRGHGVHRYHFQVFALDERLDLAAPVDRDQLVRAMRGHVLGMGEVIGTFERR